jgi:hypothetical protein
MTHHSIPIRPEQTAVYTIQIQGRIDEHWRSYFDGFEIKVAGEGRSAITTMTGRLIDQAALQGILQHLYGLGHVLLRVERKIES